MDTATDKQTEFTATVSVDPSLGSYEIEVVMENDGFSLYVDTALIGHVSKHDHLGYMVDDATAELVEMIMFSGDLHMEVEDLIQRSINSIRDDIELAMEDDSDE